MSDDYEFIDPDKQEFVWVVVDNGFEVMLREDDLDATLYHEDGEPVDLRLLDDSQDETEEE